jgi:hypothetical protein
MQHGADADIFTANMYLAEDRVSHYCPMVVMSWLSPSTCADSLLGARLETRWLMDPALCEVCVC